MYFYRDLFEYLVGQNMFDHQMHFPTTFINEVIIVFREIRMS